MFFTFTFSHLADAFIQSNLQLGLHKAINLFLHIVFCTVCKYVLSICKLFFFALSGSTLKNFTHQGTLVM